VHGARRRGPKPGAGFLIAPGVVITCAHVAGQDFVGLRVVAAGEEVGEVRAMRRLASRGRPIADLDDYPDIAVLELDERVHACVAIDQEWPAASERFQCYGYPLEGGSVNLTPAMLSYRRLQGAEATRFLYLKDDTIMPGMSGGPVLKLSTGAVCGVMVATRSATSPDGGLAIHWVDVADELGEVLAANRAFHQRDRRWYEATTRLSARRVRFKIPQPPRFFTGRSDELQRLAAGFAESDRVVVTQAITGLGGVGKSQLAAAYVHRHLDECEIVAWVAAEDGGVADLANLAAELGLPVDGLTPTDRAERVINWLGSTDRSWLLVLDNITDAAQLTGRVPATGRGQVLVTSRNRHLGHFADVLAVDVFSRETAISYLTERGGRPKEGAGAGRLADALGGLPLALAHAAAYCADRDVSFDDYHELLEALPPASLFEESPDISYQQTVASTWQPSIAAAQQRSPLSRPLLAMIAYLAPDSIPIALVDVLVDADAGVVANKKRQDALDALQRYSLTRPGETASSLDVHRLLQRVVREDPQSAAEGPLLAAAALARVFPAAVDDPNVWPLCNDLAPHAVALSETFPETATNARDVIPTLQRLTEFLYYSGALRVAVTTGTRVLALAERMLGDEHSNTINARVNLAASYRADGRVNDAIKLEELVLTDRERLLGTEHPDMITARGNLALSYRADGRVKDAIKLEELVLTDRERLLGTEHPDMITARGNLAASYYTDGRIQKAIELQEGVLADRERLLGAEHPDTITARDGVIFLRGAIASPE
jgi:Trypsin-like peptidase domain/Tetratricopeptide repeat/NB-ARC domain